MNAAVERNELAPVVRSVWGFVAPVDRATSTPVSFDAAVEGRFDVNAPPAPWLALGALREFRRTSETKVVPLRSGAPASVAVQVRSEVGAAVSFELRSWSKPAMAVASGTEQRNLLSGAAVAIGDGSTAAVLQMGQQASGFAPGGYVTVDVDHADETGYVGSGISGGFLQPGVNDADAVRRVSLNVARVAAVDDGVVTLAAPLPAGAPTAAMKVQGAAGFSDREGSSFFAEWSGLFVMDGQQGERVLLHYPRLQATASVGEETLAVGEYGRVLQRVSLRALPVRDAADGGLAVCYRTYLPGM